MKKWVMLEEKIILKHPRLTLSEHKVKLPDGSETDYLIYESYVDFPTIIAINDEGSFLVLEEPAYPVNELLFQFPEGVPEKDESLIDAAKRELLEESGFESKLIVEISTNLHEHRRSTALQHTLLATDLSLSSKNSQQDQEEVGIIVHWLSESEIWSLIKAGKIKQKNTLAAWSNYQAYKLIS